MNIVLFLQILLIVFVFIIIFLIIRQNIALRMERRIGYYSLISLKDDSISFSDRIKYFYLKLVRGNRRYIKKISYFNKKAKRYEKYIKYKDRSEILAIDFITNKLLIMVVFLILSILSGIIGGRLLSLFTLIINMIIGYYLLDVFLLFYSKRQKKLIDSELLRAIIIMNNAFKSGKSTLQALKIASEELPDPIGDEFKKMYLDMKYGLSVDTVFDRFAKRIDLEEAVFISSSLTILNKTGGNIVEVFSSIERTLFDKKKLNEELKNISASPNMVIKVLLVIPIVFTLIIYILNPDYFAPLFSSTLGYLIICIIILMFIIYILLLRRILRIEV